MPYFLRSHKAPQLETAENLRQDDRQSYILRLPSELLLEITALVWNAACTEIDRINLMNCLPLVCKTIAAAFDRVWQWDVRITSEEFYKYYMRRLSNVDRTYPMNTRCISLHFDADLTGREERAFPYIRLQPLFMELQEDPLGYFNNGREFHLKGLLPNLTNLFIHVSNFWIRDPYHTLFPHCMPRTIQNLHINYTVRIVDRNKQWCRLRLLEHLRRLTPIRYPSVPHKLKTLTVTGLGGRIGFTFARLWESLFEVEKLIVDDKALPVGEDKPWSLGMNQVLDMLELGCRGSGWNWWQRRPKDWNPLDEVMNQDVGQVDETGGLQVSRPRPIRCLSADTVERTPMPQIKRGKTYSGVPVTDYPYGTRVNADGPVSFHS